ncbi:MAG TPA: DUF4468 domain-containing protein [bacterium]|nr:DUF4468 domain-containing protein [bacterium]
MKKVIYFLLTAIVFISWLSCASLETPLTEVPKVQRIIEVNKPKDELYKLSNEWMAKTFKSSKAVIQYQDKEEGVIVGKGFTSVKYLGYVDTYFTMTIEVKDEKLRVTLEDIYLHQIIQSIEVESPLDLQQQWDKAKPELEEIIDRLEAYVKEEAEEW